MILVLLAHDFIRDTVLATISDCLLFGHNPIVICIPLLEIRQTGRITASPLFRGQPAIVIGIS